MLYLGGTIQEGFAQDAVEVAFGGLAGITTVQPNTEVQLYVVELQEAAGGRDAALKTAGAGNSEIRFSISDLTAPTGTTVADIAALNFYRSVDAIFNAGDVLQSSIVPGALGNQTISFTGPPIASPDIPDAPGSIFFIVTATISAAAVPGHAFRFGVPGGHIDVRDPPPPGPAVIYTLGTLIAANDANHILI
ncbi:MAG: hypothetical protein O2954_06075, partial [bacterium]|nr:hypothetical protein [bacterium]